jgi:hypothetical protein
MLAAFGAIEIPHMQHSTRPTVCGTSNISVATAIASKSTRQNPTNPSISSNSLHSKINSTTSLQINQTLLTKILPISSNLFSNFLPESTKQQTKIKGGTEFKLSNSSDKEHYT